MASSTLLQRIEEAIKLAKSQQHTPIRLTFGGKAWDSYRHEVQLLTGVMIGTTSTIQGVPITLNQEDFFQREKVTLTIEIDIF